MPSPQALRPPGSRLAAHVRSGAHGPKEHRMQSLPQPLCAPPPTVQGLGRNRRPVPSSAAQYSGPGPGPKGS
eukprot:3327103-Prymnesium_polylepis.2